MRKYFGTDGIRGKVGEASMHPEFLVKLAWAIGKSLARNDHARIVIGKDTRVSGDLLESAIQTGLLSAGVDTYLLGPLPTPAIAYIAKIMEFDAGIVLSASHNPYYDNGIKLFSKDGFKLDDETELSIEALMDSPMQVNTSDHLGKSYRLEDALRKYIDFCKSVIPKSCHMHGLKIVLDCANGAAYYIAPLIFAELGVDVITINNQPDGFNINEKCGSTHPEQLQAAVKKHNAALGIAFDGDADRVIMVDEHGEIVDGDELLYIIAAHQQETHNFKGGVVGTVMTNLGIEKAFTQKGIPFIRSKVGDRYVLEQLKRNDWLLGGESSGHIIHLGFTTTGDAMVSALLGLWAVVESGKTLSELRTSVKKCPQKMINVTIQSAIDATQQQKIDIAVKEIESQLNQCGRVLLRPSGTEPLMRVMVEGEDKKQVEQLTEELATTVEKILNPG